MKAISEKNTFTGYPSPIVSTATAAEEAILPCTQDNHALFCFMRKTDIAISGLSFGLFAKGKIEMKS